MGRVTTLITHIRRLITPLITTHEPPSISYAGALGVVGLSGFRFGV